MKKILYSFVFIALILTSCDKNEIDNGLTQQTIATTINDDANRKSRPVILGNKINNPYSFKNMQAALDTLKAHPEEQSSCMKAPSATLEDIVIEPTDLYVRFLPVDSIQYVQLMNDTTLILFDYPLDYQKIQTGDYYKDPTVTGKYTWLYTTVPIGYVPPVGINYEVIEELLIPEHSPYYLVEGAPAKVKAINHIKSNVVKQDDYADALKTIVAISFIITGNADQLNKPNTEGNPTGMQKAISYVKKTFLWNTWYEAVYNPEGCFTVNTPRGNLPLANVRIRVARYFTFYETRTDANGRFYFYNQFGQDAVFPNVEYFVYFDGVNGSNSWKLMNELGGTTYTSVGVHSPDRYDMTFYPSSDYWGKCVQQHAISKYIDISRVDGLSLPPSELKIDPEESSNYLDDIPLLVNHLNYGLMLTNIDFELPYQNIYGDFHNITAFAWNQLTHTSQVERLKSIKGKDWATQYWKAVRDQLQSDYSEGLYDAFGITHKTTGDWSRQIALTQGWVKYRLGELYNRYFNISDYIETNNPYLKQYVYMFRDLYNIGCSYQNMEKSLCANTITEFKNNLISYYPSLSQQIDNIVPDPDKIIPGNITFMTYNLKRDDWENFEDKWYTLDLSLINLQSSRIYALARVISCCNPDVVAIQEIESQNTFNILKSETGLDGKWIETDTDYGIGMLWKPSLGSPKITGYLITPTNSDLEKSAYYVGEFSNFYFISTHYHYEFMRITDSIINYVKTTNKPVFIGGDFNMDFNAEQKDEPLQKFIDNDLVVFNNHGDITAPNSVTNKDLLIGYKNNSTEYNVISKGIPVFPRDDWKFENWISDHFPYLVTINL